MNKKMIMLIGALVCANSMTLAFQESAETKPLTAEENEVYQGLVARFQADSLTTEDNTYANIDILMQQKEFLAQAVKAQATKKQTLWPYVLAASFYPTVRGLYTVGKVFDSLAGNKFLWNHSWTIRNSLWSVGNLLQKPLLLPFVINDLLGLPRDVFPALVAVAPLIAFYGLYKKYNSLQSQQQELEMVRDMLADLNEFGSAKRIKNNIFVT